MDIIRRDTFTGSNNIAKPERLPEGAVRRAVNLTPAVGGTLELRPGFHKEVEGSNVRAVFAMGDTVVFVDGGDLRVLTPSGAITVAQIAASGPVAGAQLNGKLYLRTPTDSLVVDGSTVTPWGIENPAFDVVVTPGHLPAGLYKIAVTAVDGAESGADVMTVTLDGSMGVSVRAAGSNSLRLYMSVANGETLYSQGPLIGLATISTSIEDGTEQLVTGGLAPMPAVDLLCAFDSVLIGAKGGTVYMSEPYMPHLYNPARGFLQYPSEVQMIAPAAPGGVFVAADKTYFVSAPGTSEAVQRAVAEYSAVPGTLATLPDSTPSWFTLYGQAIGTPDGAIRLLNSGTYAPDTAKHGAAGFFEHNGSQMLVTALRGQPEGNRLAASDYWGLEITDER